MVQYFSTVGEVRAVTLIVHGLNIKPDAMFDYLRIITESSSEVYLVSLSGHYQSDVNNVKVNHRLWEAEMLDGFDKSYKRAASLGVPIYFLGYSLGALLGQSMIASSFPYACFEKQVLIAPAIALRSHCYLLKGLFVLGVEKRLPSYTPKKYRVHNYLPLSIYEVLFKEVHNLVQARFNGLDIPTLIIIDPEDELISYKKIKAYQEQFRLNQWLLLPLNPSLKGRYIKYHHCLLDASSMGEENWQISKKKIKDFLFGHTYNTPINLEK